MLGEKNFLVLSWPLVRLKHYKTYKLYLWSHVAWVSSYNFDAQQIHQVQKGHTHAKMCQIAFSLKIFFSRTEIGVEKLNTVLES
jgi:hypothetical protein